MDFLLTIARPHIGVFTAIDAVHSEQFGNPVEIAREEVKMLKSTLEIGFLNANDVYAMQLKDQLYIDYLTYQTEGNDIKADIFFKDDTEIYGDYFTTPFMLYDSEDNKFVIQHDDMTPPNFRVSSDVNQSCMKCVFVRRIQGSLVCTAYYDFKIPNEFHVCDKRTRLPSHAHKDRAND